MARHGENIYRRKDGRWEARVIKGYDMNGKALYAYFYGRSYKEAKGKIMESLPFVNLVPGAVTTNESETLKFKNLLDSWLENSKIKLKEPSYVRYFNHINNHIQPMLGKLSVSEITNEVLNSFAAKKLKSGKLNNPGGLSEKTVKDIMTLVKSVVRFAQERALMLDVKVNLTLPREKKADIRVLTREEQTALEKHLCTNTDESKLGIILCLYTGLRIGDAYVKHKLKFFLNIFSTRKKAQFPSLLMGSALPC